PVASITPLYRVSTKGASVLSRRQFRIRLWSIEASPCHQHRQGHQDAAELQRNYRLEGITQLASFAHNRPHSTASYRDRSRIAPLRVKQIPDRLVSSKAFIGSFQGCCNAFSREFAFVAQKMHDSIHVRICKFDGIAIGHIRLQEDLPDTLCCRTDSIAD